MRADMSRMIVERPRRGGGGRIEAIAAVTLRTKTVYRPSSSSSARRRMPSGVARTITIQTAVRKTDAPPSEAIRKRVAVPARPERRK